jgi:hypothetical protein
MVNANGVLYAVEPNHGELDSITASGIIRRVSDISLIQGHIVPTAIAYDGTNFFVSNLDTFPIKDGSSKIMKITPSGTLTTAYIGFTTVLGLAFDNKGRLYVLENTTGNPFPTPGTGRVVRINGKKQQDSDCNGFNLTDWYDVWSRWQSVCFKCRLRPATGRARRGSQDQIAQTVNSKSVTALAMQTGPKTNPRIVFGSSLNFSSFSVSSYTAYDHNEHT